MYNGWDQTYENFEFNKNVAEQDFFFSDIFRDLFGPGPNWKSGGSTAKLAMLKTSPNKRMEKNKTNWRCEKDGQQQN